MQGSEGGRLTYQQAQVAVAKELQEEERQGIENIRKMTGADISGHKPEDLLLIDAVLTPRFREILRGRNEIVGAATMFGTFLGEVLVRNLGGQWHYPSWLQALRAHLSRDRFRGGARYFYIMLDRERVYVYQAAHDAIEKTGAVFSLFAFYERYAGRFRHSRPPGN